MLNWLKKFSRASGTSRSQATAGAQALFVRGRDAAAAGDARGAAALLVAAIDADPAVAEFHYELGRAMRALSEPARAVTCFRRAIALDARHADAHIDLASALLGLGHPEAAERSAQAALSLDANSVAARVNLGAALADQRRFAEAADQYRAALAVDPASVPALSNLSAACLQLGAVDEARRSAEDAVRLAPRDADAHTRLGNALMEQRLPEQAAERYREVLRLRPGAAAFGNLGFAQDMQGRPESAMGYYAQALEADPEDVQAHLGRAAIWLLQEDFARGWPEYEWRMRSPAHAPLYARYARYAHPRWDGSPLGGRRILVYAEQGLGDEILFASCLPEVLAQAGHCVIDCETRLAGLLRRSFPQATVHGGRQTDPTDWLAGAGRIDVAIPAGSLPSLLRRSPAAFPRHAGYLRAAPERVAAWRERLRALGPGLKVGLSWRGGVPQTGRGSRSLALAELLPVLRLPGVTFVNLQYGESGAELAALERQHGVSVRHWREAIDDYDETAALVSALDLTLSVCTALVDLGGALGRPVWALAPVRSDFRYGLKGEAIPWYPSVRVFRQAQYAQWEPVVAAAANALRELRA